MKLHFMRRIYKKLLTTVNLYGSITFGLSKETTSVITLTKIKNPPSSKWTTSFYGSVTNTVNKNYKETSTNPLPNRKKQTIVRFVVNGT